MLNIEYFTYASFQSFQKLPVYKQRSAFYISFYPYLSPLFYWQTISMKYKFIAITTESKLA